MNWGAVEAASTLVTALIALYLLRQGQRDRRRIREDQHSAQARDVIVQMREDWEPIDGSKTHRRFQGARVWVLNNSDRPVTISGIDYVAHLPDDPDIGPVHVTHVDMQDAVLLIGRSDASWDLYRCGGFAIVDYIDHQGQMWQRRSDDLELRAQPRQLRWWQRAVQRMCRARPLHAILLGGWMKLAYRSARKHGPDRMPVSLRWVRFLFGSWPAGEADPWLKPVEHQALYGFTELYDVAICRDASPLGPS